MNERLQDLLKNGPKVINIGVEQFALDLEEQEVPTVQMDWRPPQVESDLLSKLKKLRKK
ncbi:MAG: hypothetical protein XD80_0399 [Synergistales bacterium 53_16]|jgi:hypothetical protein|nr:MAG: hypothetical protein XD80_0399 [Synergistales bacterium 53_16]KUL03529.1 MAG: hypothetical protein XE12_0478 [Synergistales bacterium 54_9]MDK2846517.1 hypothetical protein [Synergistales bacterium]MDN5335459.1 hypothetical protein [Synergistales bacterium]